MAVYRSDQAQFTFAAEAGDGGYPEVASAAAYSDVSVLTRTVYPGDRSIGVTSGHGTKFVPGTIQKRFIAIGTDSNLDTTIPSDCEVRRVVFVDGDEIYLDVPLGFPHAAADTIRTITESVTATDAITDKLKGVAGSGTATGLTVVQSDKLITWVPGVYDTIDTPDPQEAMEPRYMLGQNTNRNAFQIYKGQQTFTGSVAGMVLLNGMPLRFPLGRVVSNPSAAGTAVSAATLSGTKGSTRIKLSMTSGSATVFIQGATLLIDPAAGTTNDQLRASGQEIRKIVFGGSSSSGTNTIFKLNYPLFNTHVGVAVKIITHSDSIVYTHHILEDVNLSTVSWNVNVKDEAGANPFQRRYYGGLVGGMTISAEEGGLLTCGWDTATFLGMSHSVQNSDRSNVPMQRFTPMHDITKTDIGTPSKDSTTVTVANSAANELPGTEPYYFSEGNIKMWGQTVARVRNFTINVTNGEEVRYYIRRADPDNRGPFEVRPGQRGYTMSATIGLPNAGTPTGTETNFNDATSMSLWKELLQSGDYTVASSSSNIGHAGFNIELQFTRGKVGSSTTDDTLTIRIPNDYDGSSEGTGSSTANQGAFIQTAPVPIDGAVPMEQSADIIFKSMKIEIADNEPFYP